MAVELGQVLPKYHEELFEGWRFADTAEPQQKDGEARVLNPNFSLGIVDD